ncbi:TapB family protein [Pontibacter liquoris]|uniref:TapB family protein n=1 Tax=Pontibacter liquoris TaxID=2905677 RepID=UPI001FA8183E|nr:hypothetical protein [Pontibacter liquoris]
MPVPIEEVVPLQVGNKWVYQVTAYDTSGSPLSTSSFIRSVLKDTIIQKSTWYILNNGSIVQNSAEGYVYYNTAGKQPVLIYQGPDYGGIGYMYKYPQYDLWVLTTRTNKLNTVATAAGTFDSYLFKIDNQRTYHTNISVFSMKQDDYVAPGMGLIRSDTYYTDSDKIMKRQELVSYTFR